MFCPDCGHELQEGHAFCKYCGARLDDADSAPAEAAPPAGAGGDEAPASPMVAPPTDPTPLPPVDAGSPAPTDPTPPPPPPVDLAPVATASPRPSNNTRVLLIIAAVVVGLLVLAAAAAALFLPIRAETSTNDGGSTVIVEEVATNDTGTTGTAATGTTGGNEDTTTLTVPSYHPADNTGTVPVTTPGGGDNAPEAYVENLNRMDGVLYDADGKMMAIADKINATTPYLPTSVFEDLVSVGDDVMSSYDWLIAETPPAGYEEAHDLILQAGDAMITRIDKTKQGFLAIDGEGTTEAGLPFFAEAAAAKDEFTKLYAKYQQARP